jgi:transcriptional regulator with XRE-family HTH domain
MPKRTGRPPGVRPDGPKVRSLRVDRGLTAAELGAKVGYSADAVWAAERGNAIGDVFASRLAKALSIPDERVTVDDITVSDDAESEPEPKALAS